VVQIARAGVHIARKSRNWKESKKSLGYPAQTHTGGWIRISRTPLRRWINPDPLGSRSKGPKRGALDRVRTHPVPAPYIKGLNPVPLIFLQCFSFFSSLFSLLMPARLMNPNPKLLKPTQKSTNHGLIPSSYRSKHESVTEKRMHPLKRCRSWILDRGFWTVLVLFLVRIFF